MKSITEVVQNLLKPYIDRNIETATGVLGAKNLLPNNATSQTINGITFTVNADGSVTVNGTATANAELDIATNIPLSGDFILSDAIAGESGHYWAFATVDSGARQYILTSTEMPITVATKLDYFRIKVFSGETVSNVTFKPMIRPATIADNTYAPYAMTNRELMDTVAFLQTDVLGINYTGSTTWRYDINLRHSIDDYKILGFELIKADSNFKYAFPQVLIPVSEFKQTSASIPLYIYADPADIGNDAKKALGCYVDSTTVGFFLGSAFSTSIRLGVFGIK